MLKLIKLNRDSLGRFTNGIKNHDFHIHTLNTVFGAAFVLGLVAGVQTGNWWIAMDRHFQSPIVVEMNKGDTALYISKLRPVIVSEAHKPQTVLSPLAQEIIAPQSNVALTNLTPVEQVLMDKFGVANYQVIRATVKCESNFRPDAINWGSHDVGVMQINMPIWQEKIKEKFGYSIADMFDAKKNIEVGYWIWDRANGVEGDGIGSVEPWVASTTACFREAL